jgi:hypothetical protein
LDRKRSAAIRLSEPKSTGSARTNPTRIRGIAVIDSCQQERASDATSRCHEVAGVLRDSVLLCAAQSCSVGDNATNVPRTLLIDSATCNRLKSLGELRTMRSGVRISPGAPSNQKVSARKNVEAMRCGNAMWSVSRVCSFFNSLVARNRADGF